MEEKNNEYKVVTEKRKIGSTGKTIRIVIFAILITVIVTSFVILELFKTGVISVKTKSYDFSDITSKMEYLRALIDKNYLGEIDEEELNDAAIKGYIDGIDDPYTEYISASEMEEYTQELVGNFTGIGIYMIQDEETDMIKVLSPIKNSPAEKAGILPNDIIKSVNGVEYKGSEMTVAATNIKGEEGSTVKLEIIRGTETLNFDIKREKINLNPIVSEVKENNIGYINFTSFDEDTAEGFKTAYQELKDKGIKSLVIDLRNNGGGIVTEALEIADYIADKNSTLLYEIDKDGKEEETKSQNDPIVNVPVVILVNENTASASEILAGALKDLGKAKIVGTTTYGKGVIQKVFTLPDGSGIKITSEEYKTPNRNEINKVGIESDLKVELSEELKNVLVIPEDQDIQLQKAIELVK